MKSQTKRIVVAKGLEIRGGISVFNSFSFVKWKRSRNLLYTKQIYFNILNYNLKMFKIGNLMYVLVTTIKNENKTKTKTWWIIIHVAESDVFW